MTVREATQRLGVSDQAVRQLAASGRLQAVKRGGAWWLDGQAVERRRRQATRRGRPLSPRMAWSVLLLASGLPDSELLWSHDRHQARTRSWLLANSLSDRAGFLRARASRECFDAHPSELARILARPDTMRTGVSAGELVGLHGGRAEAEAYAPAGARQTIVAEHVLQPGDGPVLIRWVADDLWPVIAADTAPRAAVAVDLLESEDPRARRQAARALSR